MRTRSKQSGLTLPEIAVVIATIALLAGFALPAVRALLNSFKTQSGAKTLISTALASARAIAAKEQRYAGIRFQQDSAGNQYMVFIIHEEPSKMGNLTIGFRAVEGVKPIELPEKVAVMDLRYNPDLFNPPADSFIDSDVEIDNANVFRDTTSFSIIFSPSGKLVIHDVRVRNRDGIFQPNNDPTLNDPSKVSMDEVFNSPVNITNYGIGMFIQDDYPAMGLWAESSRNSFVIIYEKDKFQQARKMGRAWSDYLQQEARDRIYINAYTGTMILPD
jgi:type II secretory pathway pseudopilin PulG